MSALRLAIVASHPVQYYGPLYRELAQRIELEVLFAHRATPADQARAGFGVAFEWDIDLTTGYTHTFLDNVAKLPATDRFAGCDTPEIGSKLDHGNFDALLVHGWHLKSYVQAVVAAKQRGIPVLVRGDSQLASPRSRLKRVVKELAFPPLLRVFDAALYVGSRSRDYYLHYRYPSNRLFFSPHCVDTQRFAARATQVNRNSLRAQLGVNDDVYLLLFVGRLVKFKRPADLINAAARCRARGHLIEVLLAGDGDLKPAVKSAAAINKVPLHHLGFCNQSQMPAVYAAADCLVLPSDEQETWGLVANEALASGRPIIVSDSCGCAADLLNDGSAGRIYEGGNVDALADAIESIVKQPPKTESLASKAAAYSLEVAAAGIETALLDVSRK